ncbi:MAG: hypothetical protein ABI646_02495, partial [Acidobacteriota bacterium]
SSHCFMKVFIIAAVTLLFIFGVASSSSAQGRDYMTEAEIELVRDNQDIDTRVDVLTKMIDRRFNVLRIEVGGWKETEKDQKLWGDVPTGTRSNLLYDVRQILQKAVDDIDDVAEHNENTLTQNKTEGLLFPVAVRALAAAANRYLPALRSMLEKTTDERDKGVILTSIESCQAIIDSVSQLPPEIKPTKKKGKS